VRVFLKSPKTAAREADFRRAMIGISRAFRLP
jgi:hypothetical protein